MVSKGKRGITLISLVVTIIVLLILAGISIQAITGNEGIIDRAIRAKESSEINNEKEILETATTKAMGKHKYGSITQVGLEDQLEIYKTDNPTSIEYDEDTNMLYVTFTNSKRTYQVDNSGNVTYLGTETELRNTVNISANPESSTTPQLIQYVDLTVSSYVGLEDDEIFIHYAWTNSETEEPADTDYVAANAQVSTSKRKRTATITSSATQEGNYYLYVQVKLTNNTITKKFGPYAIKDHTTLRSCVSETQSTSPFLGNSTIIRNKVERVNLVTSIDGHSISDTNCWDVSDSQNGKILAWYEDTDSDGYYEVTIGQDGGINANTNSSYLFNYIGYNGDDTTVISGIENLDTELVTNMQSMFDHCNNLTSLDLSNFDTSNVTSMGAMFRNCGNLTSLDVSSFNTNRVKDMGLMFAGCGHLTSLDVSNFDTNKVTDMYYMFHGCNNLKTIYAGDKWNTDNVASSGCSGCMFLYDTNLVGGAGTTYDSSHVDKEYAHIDGGTSNPGYFTSK